MDYYAWEGWYAEIAATLRLSKAEDQAATDELSSLLRDHSTIEELKQRLKGRAAIVFGAGPSLELDIRRAKEEPVLSDVTKVCADGATSAFLRITGEPPDIIASDLDGDMDDIRYANSRGAFVLVHAHGDNMPAVKQYTPLLSEPLLGTTQVEGRDNVYNFGGFTDGDRAAFVAELQGANPILLAGMDLGLMVGKYSKPGLREDVRASKRKMMKLGIAKRLLEWLGEYGRSDLANCTSGGEDLKGIPRVSWSNLRSVIL